MTIAGFIVVIIVIVIAGYFIVTKNNRVTVEETEEDEVDEKTFTVEKMMDFVKRRLDEITKVNMYDIESRQYMQRVLINMGVMKELRQRGIKEGDSVDIVGYKFEYEE